MSTLDKFHAIDNGETVYLQIREQLREFVLVKDASNKIVGIKPWDTGNPEYGKCVGLQLSGAFDSMLIW